VIRICKHSIDISKHSINTALGHGTWCNDLVTSADNVIKVDDSLDVEQAATILGAAGMYYR